MKKAYIILAHKNPAQLYRMIKALDDNLSHFFVHIDKRTNISAFDNVCNYGKQVTMIKRESTGWGGYGLVSATLNGMRAAAESHINFDVVTLLSGEDYPVKSNREIDRFFQSSEYSIFLEHFELPDYVKWENGGGFYRINKYFFGLGPTRKIAAKTLNFMSLFIPVLRRKYSFDLKPYWGSQWWSIDMHGLRFILNYVKSNPAYCRFHRFTFAPDEVFFQTILLNTNDEHIIAKLKNDARRFVIWETGSAAHPKALGIEDFKEILESDALFARKFDITKDEEILNMIDREFLKIHNNSAARA